MIFNQFGFRLCDSFVAANETYAEFGFLPLGKMNFTKQVDFTFAIFHLFLDAPRIFFFLVGESAVLNLLHRGLASHHWVPVDLERFSRRSRYALCPQGGPLAGRMQWWKLIRSYLPDGGCFTPKENRSLVLMTLMTCKGVAFQVRA